MKDLHVCNVELCGYVIFLWLCGFVQCSTDGPSAVQVNPNETPVRVKEGSSFSSNCKSEWCNPKCKFTWWRLPHDKEISSSSSLSLLSVSQNDTGRYYCIASATNGSFKYSEPIDINVTSTSIYEPELIGTYPNTSSITERENKHVSFGCTADSNPPSNISWTFQYNQSVLLTEYNTTESNFSIINTECCNSGIYKCSAFNGVGEAADAHFTLSVTCKPKFNYPSTNKYMVKTVGTLGGSLTSSVNVFSNPHPTAYSTSRINVTVQREIGSHCLYRVEMVIYSLQETDVKEHEIKLENDFGNATIVINILLKSSSYLTYVIIKCVVALVLAASVIICLAIQRYKLKTRQSEMHGSSSDNQTPTEDVSQGHVSDRPIPKARNETTQKQTDEEADGLNYIQVDFNSKNSGHIHGLKNKINYVEVQIISDANYNEPTSATDTANNNAENVYVNEEEL